MNHEDWEIRVSGERSFQSLSFELPKLWGIQTLAESDHRWSDVQQNSFMFNGCPSSLLTEWSTVWWFTNAYAIQTFFGNFLGNLEFRFRRLAIPESGAQDELASPRKIRLKRLLIYRLFSACQAPELLVILFRNFVNSTKIRPRFRCRLFLLQTIRLNLVHLNVPRLQEQSFRSFKKFLAIYCSEYRARISKF